MASTSIFDGDIPIGFQGRSDPPTKGKEEPVPHTPSSPAPPSPTPPEPLTASDVALRTHDVLSNIFQHIAVDSMSDSEDLEHTTRRNLFLAAQTCKDFVEPALDSLWAVLPSLVPLLSLLPSFRKANDKFVLGYVGPNDWERFDVHARRVRTLLMRKPHHTISPYVYLRIPHHKTSDLIPGLKEIRIAHRSSYSIDLSGLFSILTPNVRLLELNESTIQNTEFFGTFLSAAVTKTPDLRHIILRGNASVDQEVNSILQFTSLKSVELLLPNIYLSVTLIEGLGKFEDLFKLILDTGKRAPTSPFGSASPATSAASGNKKMKMGGRKEAVPLRHRFSTLRQLHLVGNLESLARTMRYMKPKSLISFKLEERQDGQCESAASLWMNCFETLSSTAAHSLKTIKISHSADNYSPHRLSATLISPLLTIKNLEVLEITTSTLSLSDKDLQRILSSFTRLKTLVLPPWCHEFSPTIRPLLRPFEICPALEELTVCVHPTHNYADIRILGEGHRALRRLCISSSFGQLTDTQVIQLARLFDRAFPNLEMIEGHGPHVRNESWNRVQEFRRAVQEVRREFTTQPTTVARKPAKRGGKH